MIEIAVCSANFFFLQINGWFIKGARISEQILLVLLTFHVGNRNTKALYFYSYFLKTISVKANCTCLPLNERCTELSKVQIFLWNLLQIMFCPLNLKSWWLCKASIYEWFIHPCMIIMDCTFAGGLYFPWHLCPERWTISRLMRTKTSKQGSPEDGVNQFAQ